MIKFEDERLACRNYIIEQLLNINLWLPERFQIKIYDLGAYPCSLQIKAPIALLNATTFEQRKQSRWRAKRKQSSYKNRGIFGKVPERLTGRGMATGGQQGNIVISRLGVHRSPMALRWLRNSGTVTPSLCWDSRLRSREGKKKQGWLCSLMVSDLGRKEGCINS